MGFVDGLIKVIGFFMEEGANSYERTAREARSQARRTGNQANYERANEALSEIKSQRENWNNRKKAIEDNLEARKQQREE